MNAAFLLRPIASRRELHKRLHEVFVAYMPNNALVYDIGCGEKPFAEFLKGRVRRHVGVDLADGFYAADRVDLIGTAYDVPAPSGSADAIILSQVIEHLETPLMAMKEASRLLKPGGVLFLSFPFLYPQHAQPRDYLRYTEYYLKSSLAGDTFDIVECKRIGGLWYLLAVYLTIYLQSFDRGLLKRLFLAKALTSVTGFICLGLHTLEGGVLKLLGKNPEEVRASWTVDYVTVLRKR
jgi:SAM-dependent methyltransferase